MPGSGKTTLGKYLSKLLNISFLDTDKLIVEHCKMRIPKIFNIVGESGFRNIEHIVLTKLANSNDFVLATGGGMPCFFNNMQILNDLGTTIYLKPDFEELFNRLRNSKQDRPLLAGKSDEELKKYLSETISKREQHYLGAQFVYDFSTQFDDFLIKNKILIQDS